MKNLAKLILMRHGKSVWNELELFTGWVDIPLSLEGVEEALQAGKKIANIPIDLIFTSSLVRTQMTAMLAMSQHQSGKIPYFLHPASGKLENWSHIYNQETQEKMIPAYSAWQLNERMYGKLQGLNKKETIRQYGEEQVKLWRRSFDISPPEGESLAMTAERTIPYFKNHIVPELEKGKNILVSAHGNSLRAIIMHLKQLSKEEVIALEVPTGESMIYCYEQGKWREEFLNG